MGTGSLTSEHVWRAASAEAPASVDVPQLIVPEAFAVPLTGLDVDAEVSLAHPSSGARGVVSEAPAVSLPAQNPGMVASVRHTLKTKWFWYAMASSLCWTGWAFTAKIGSREIPPAAMEFVSALGFLLVSLGVLRPKAAQRGASRKGRGFALVSGILLALGGICLYGAYRTGYNASMITAVTSLYPMVTVLGAVWFLRERLNKMQVLGLLFAVAAMSILSL